jgi:probable rRNA maturation factor
MAESARDGKTLAQHFAHLAIHATLHLTGHDHEDDAEAEIMEAAEIALLSQLGIADPYRTAQSGSEGVSGEVVL